MGHDPALTGRSPDPLISTANASKLGVKWMASTGATVLSSPVVAYNTLLHESVVYQGTEAGSLNAFNAATGQEIWSDTLGSAIRDTPLVEGNYVWVSNTYSPSLYKIDAASGQVMCSVPMVSTQNGSATIGTPPGGKLTVYIGVLDLGTASGPIYSGRRGHLRGELEVHRFQHHKRTMDTVGVRDGRNRQGADRHR